MDVFWKNCQFFCARSALLRTRFDLRRQFPKKGGCKKINPVSGPKVLRNKGLKREFSQLRIVRDDLGNSLLPNNLRRFTKQTPYTWCHVWEKFIPHLVAPLLPEILVLNTIFRTENCSRSSSELTICEISDSKNFDFSATSSWTKKKVSDFFLQNPETSNNSLSNELSDVFELPKLISWDGFEKSGKNENSFLLNKKSKAKRRGGGRRVSLKL